LNTAPTGPESCDDEAWLLTDPPEPLELDPPFDSCLAGLGATALPGDPSEPPPGPLPGPPAAGHAERNDVTSAIGRTVAPDADADADADAEVVAADGGLALVGWAVSAEIGVSQAPARHTIAAPPDTSAAGLTRDITGVDTMMITPLVRGS
jgi:hypothetical protein